MRLQILPHRPGILQARSRLLIERFRLHRELAVHHIREPGNEGIGEDPLHMQVTLLFVLLHQSIGLAYLSNHVLDPLNVCQVMRRQARRAWQPGSLSPPHSSGPTGGPPRYSLAPDAVRPVASTLPPDCSGSPPGPEPMRRRAETPTARSLRSRIETALHHIGYGRSPRSGTPGSTHRTAGYSPAQPRCRTASLLPRRPQARSGERPQAP